MTIRASDGAFAQAVDAFEARDWGRLKDTIMPCNSIAKATAQFEDIEVRDNYVFYQGEPIHGVIVDRILSFRNAGADMLPLMKFLAKLMLNPSKRAVDELYKFLEHKNLPITLNGNFLAYKAVDRDFYSYSSGNAKLLKGSANEGGHIYNGVGEEIQIPRNQVDDNKENGCSYGLHAGSLEYASSFRRYDGKLLIVEIDPADVVSIPTDCNCQKLRTARYKVVDEFKGELSDVVYRSRFSTENDATVNSQFDDESENEESGCFDADGEQMIPGRLYINGFRDTIFYWDGSAFIEQGGNNWVMAFHEVSDPYLIDEDDRKGYDGDDLIDGEVYRCEDDNLYRWVEATDQFVTIRPDNGETVSYIESLTMTMELA